MIRSDLRPDLSLLGSFTNVMHGPDARKQWCFSRLVVALLLFSGRGWAFTVELPRQSGMRLHFILLSSARR